MPLKRSMIDDLESQSRNWTKRLTELQEDLEKRLSEASDDQIREKIEREFAEQVLALEENIELGRKTLYEIQEAGGNQLEELRKTIEDWLPSNTN
ncbi:hypothetical protein [Marinobacter mobilis]|uniref:Uncharacterized protein n=2 Tax=Marinobacter mobilis TaxID=488533 RepID=A0A1H2T1Z7_9GAMM|nr:hypothetical protein [Marinobacter mobilis]SDW37973.1 hypothetical protein SAMN04487960_102315 [Marinobacter mobilis]